jgi:hypothetical protein
MRTSPTDIGAAGHSVARGWLEWIWPYLGGRRALVILAIIGLLAGAALNWSWLVAAGIAPILLSVLPCLVMCGLGLCMNRLIGRSCGAASSQSPGNPGSPTTALPVLNQTAPDISPTRVMGGDRGAVGERTHGDPAETVDQT